MTSGAVARVSQCCADFGEGVEAVAVGEPDVEEDGVVSRRRGGG